VHRDPSRHAIKAWVSRWRETGSVRDTKRPGQQPSVRLFQKREQFMYQM
jgi:transposase